MNDNYKFEKKAGVKIIVENEKGEVLLIKEPPTNEWMPGRWGLPGGKPLIHESLLSAYKRKLKEETGLETEPLGIYRIDELLFDDRTIYFFHLVTKIDMNINLPLNEGEYRWVSKDTLSNMEIDQFTEYFNKELVFNYISGAKELIPLALFKTWNYYNMNGEKDYQKWLNAK